MKAKRVASVNLISAALAGILFACSAVAFTPSDDKNKKEKTATPPPARTAPAPSQPAATPPPHRSAPPPQQAPQQQAPQHPMRTAPTQPAPQPTRTAPQVNNAPRTQPPVQNNTPQGYNNPRVNTRQPVNQPTQPNGNQPNVIQPGGRRPQPNISGQPSTPYAPSNPNRPGPMNAPNNPNAPRGYPPGGSAPAARNNFRDNAPSRSYVSPSGQRADFRGPTVRTLTTPSGMRINHVGPTREVVARRGDRVFVTNARGNGYVQRNVIVRNQRFVQRTYYSNGIRYAHVYRPYSYRGTVVNVYTPVRYYRPGFYAYAYSPWRTPVYYQWGWVNDPWYGAYGGAYFSPYPVYPRPSLWLTDYLIATSFREAYQVNQDAGVVAGNNFAAGAPMGDDVKQLVSLEVQRQLTYERSQAQQPQMSQNAPSPDAEPPVVADHASHTLLAYSSLNADAGGQECAITEGDVLQFDASQALSGPSGSAQVLWSKPDDCRSGSVITVPVEQLQEMQNHMAENLNQGLQEMQNQQGQNGMPKLAPSLVGSTQASFAAELPPPEPNVADELKAQAQEADSAVNQVTEEANRAWAPPPAPVEQPVQAQPQPQVQTQVRPPVTIVKGMALESVTSQLGNPAQSLDLGKKKMMYIYANPNLKITFKNGRVDKVE
jgi:hypothetical protein